MFCASRTSLASSALPGSSVRAVSKIWRRWDEMVGEREARGWIDCEVVPGQLQRAAAAPTTRVEMGRTFWTNWRSTPR